MEMLSGLMLAVALIAAGCTSASEGTTEVAEVATPTPADEVAATPTPVPVVSPEMRIDAALAALNSDGAGELIAWDVLDSSVDADGVVDLTLCGWTGETVFDAVYSSLWTTMDEAGEVAATELGISVTEGECLNTELIDSAFATITRHDELWAAAIADPGTFEQVPELVAMFAPAELEVARRATTQWDADGITIRNSRYEAPISEDLSEDPLWRRYVSDRHGSVLDLAFCREMFDGYGFYRGEELVDDERDANAVGTSAVSAYVLARSPDGWLVADRQGLSWADCLSVDSWPDAASDWRPAPSSYRRLQ